MPWYLNHKSADGKDTHTPLQKATVPSEGLGKVRTSIISFLFLCFKHLAQTFVEFQLSLKGKNLRFSLYITAIPDRTHGLWSHLLEARIFFCRCQYLARCKRC